MFAKSYSYYLNVASYSLFGFCCYLFCYIVSFCQLFCYCTFSYIFCISCSIVASFVIFAISVVMLQHFLLYFLYQFFCCSIFLLCLLDQLFCYSIFCCICYVNHSTIESCCNNRFVVTDIINRLYHLFCYGISSCACCKNCSTMALLVAFTRMPGLLHHSPFYLNLGYAWLAHKLAYSMIP